MTMAASKPTSFLAESLAILSKSVYQAFADIEHVYKIEVASAQAAAHEAGRERDEAVKALHASQLGAEVLKQELTTWQAALKQAETTIAHQEEKLAQQAETIVQFKRESTQWKDQTRNWQDHFLRVEQERCALSTRIEELFCDQLQANQASLSNLPYTPRQNYGVDNVESGSSSLNTKQASASLMSSGLHRPADIHSPTDNHAIQKSTHSGPTIKPQLKTKLLASAKRPQPAAVATDRPSTPTQSMAQHTASKSNAVEGQSRPQQMQQQHPRSAPVTIRRVQAVINVPVKEEVSEEEGPLNQRASTSSAPASISDVARTSHPAAKASIHHRRKAGAGHVVSDDDYEQEDSEAEESEVWRDAGEDGGQSHGDEEDDELMIKQHDFSNTYATRNASQFRGPRHGRSITVVGPPGKRQTTGREKAPAKRRKV